MLHFNFHSSQRISQFLVIYLWPIGHFLMYCLLSIYLEFSNFLLLPISIFFFYCGQRTYLAWVWPLQIYWDQFCDLTYALPRKIFYVHLRGMCILLLGRVLCRWLLSLFHIVQVIHYFVIFCLIVLIII